MEKGTGIKPTLPPPLTVHIGLELFYADRVFIGLLFELPNNQKDKKKIGDRLNDIICPPILNEKYYLKNSEEILCITKKVFDNFYTFKLTRLNISKHIDDFLYKKHIKSFYDNHESFVFYPLPL